VDDGSGSWEGSQVSRTPKIKHRAVSGAQRGCACGGTSKHGADALAACGTQIPGKISNSSLDAMNSSPKEACGGRYAIKRCRRHDGQIRGLQTNLRDDGHRGSRKDTEYA
jgi:hypothetical protein